MYLKNRISVKIQHTSQEHLAKLELLADKEGEEKFAYLTGAFEFHLKDCHEILKDCLQELLKLEKEVQISRSINKANYEKK
tara:strand:+ start:520 stop:762 length:243 start_codon:yes stop_codon:yes gene_type:complete